MIPYGRALCGGLLLACLVPTGCEPSETPAETPSAPGAAASRPTVYVVNYPLQYFARRIAGDAAEIVFPAPSDEDPAYWKPDADTIMAYQQADLVLLNGASYAHWVEHATLPASKVLDTSEAFQDGYIEAEAAVVHAHGPEGEHAHTGVAFTTWLDPRLAVRHAEAVRDGLAKRMPNQADALTRNFEALKQDLEALDRGFEELTARDRAQPLLASHPVYQYFARRYGLNLKSVHWEPGDVPDERQWTELDALLQEHPAKWMIWEAPPTSQTEEKLRERGVRCVVFYPCGNVPTSGDYLQTMQGNLEALKPVFPSP